MPLDLTAYCELRPFLYHLTARSNLDRIRREARLRTAIELLALARQTHQSRTRRADHLSLPIDDAPATLRDQKPLHAGNVALQGGWTFEDLIFELNSRVFFWPGTESAPVSSGQRHFGRYKHDDCVVLVVPAAAVFAANPNLQPEFCRYNSGSPRCNAGLKSPRGPETFLPAHRFNGTPGSVVETVFRGSVTLPRDSVSVRAVSDWIDPGELRT